MVRRRGFIGGKLIAAAAALYTAPCGLAAAAEAPRAAVRGEFDSDLRRAIEAAIGTTDSAADDVVELRRRAENAAEDAVAVLRSEGYYAYQIDADVSPEEPFQAVVDIAPGPRFTIQSPQVSWLAPEPPARIQRAGAAAMGLNPGDPGRAALVIAAEGRVVAAVQALGYADAHADPRRVIVDHATTAVRPTFRIAAGPLVRLGGVETPRRTRTRAAWLGRLAPWRGGDAYSPDKVAELERRLLDTGVYDSVTVALAPAAETTPEGLRPVIISLRDRKPHLLELGATYSTIDGAGLDARWTRYNVLGRADTLKLTGRLSGVDSRAAVDLSLPHWRKAQQTLTLGLQAYRSNTDAFDQAGIGARADLTRRLGKTTYLSYGTTVDYSRVDELADQTLTSQGRRLLTATVYAAGSLDRSDDPLDPRHGWRAQGRAEPTIVAGDASLGYLELSAQGSAYVPLGQDARTVLAGRLRLGSLVGARLPQTPGPRRFYAGGGGSVRGYGYQAVGPRLADNTPMGGLSLVEASFEVRRQITDRWGAVVFADAGAVGRRATPGFDNLSVGVGVGVRYDLGFGPIRADIAVPLDRDAGSGVQLYLSIGQSF